MAIDLCERAKVWRVALTPIVLVSGTYNYALTSPVAGTEVSVILSASMSLASTGAKRKVTPTTMEFVADNIVQWPDVNALGEPQIIFKIAEDSFNLHPVPGSDDTYTLQVQAAIRPAVDGANWESALAAQYMRVIYHGVLHELMMIPDRVWTDDQKSLYHGKQWTFMVNSARARANKGFSRTDLTVIQRPLG